MRRKISLCLSRLRSAHAASPARFWRMCLFWSFWVTVALFPIGYGFREVSPLVCAIFLALYYREDWQHSTLARLPVRGLFCCAALMTLVGVLFSTDPWRSFLHAGMGINKGYILPFIAMECVRDERDLRRLVAACGLACFWEGLDGIWQFFTGSDFIMGYQPREGRLSGSFADYAVGNYIALAMLPVFGAWFLLRRRWSFAVSLLLLALLLFPPLFLLVGSGTRSGVLALASSCGFWMLLRGKLRWRYLLLAAAIFGLFALLRQGRLSLETIGADGRWSLWSLGWSVFLEHPWLGAGAGQYNAVFRSLGLVPERDVITISHPHNLYLDILYAHGIVGFLLGMIFLFGFLFWGYRQLRPHLCQELRDDPPSCYWRMTAWFWIAYGAWFVNGIFGHDFYRIWWLALSMTHMGIMIGAVVNGPKSPPLSHSIRIPHESSPASGPSGRC